MSDTIVQSVGVDISKDTLDVHLHPAGTARRFANTRRGRSGLIAWLAEFTFARIVFEPPGPTTMASSGNSPRPDSRSPRSTPVRPAALPRRSAGTPKLMPSMLRCSPASPRSSSRRCAQP
jgi:hypothetical protein